jgi:hypothetical protein
MSEVQRWLSDNDLKGLYTASYWNDIEDERKKPWWIEDGDYQRCRRYLEHMGCENRRSGRWRDISTQCTLGNSVDLRQQC